MKEINIKITSTIRLIPVRFKKSNLRQWKWLFIELELKSK